MVQNCLPELYENSESLEDLIHLPRSALIKIFQSDRSCASEMIFFEILSKISQQNNNIPQKLYSLYPKINKSSVDTQEDRHITINELEEEKFEEDDEEEEHLNKNDKKINKTSEADKEDDEEGEEDDSECKSQDEEEKSLKLDIISERTEPLYQVDTRKCINDLIPHVRLSLINRKELITKIRDSKYFADDSIFEALIFQEFPERLNNKSLKKNRRRGFKVEFDLVHENIEVKPNPVDKRISMLLKRVQKSETNESRYVTATHSEPLPLHGLHYFEIMILPSENQNVANKIFVGL